MHYEHMIFGKDEEPPPSARPMIEMSFRQVRFDVGTPTVVKQVFKNSPIVGTHRHQHSSTKSLKTCQKHVWIEFLDIQ